MTTGLEGRDAAAVALRDARGAAGRAGLAGGDPRLAVGRDPDRRRAQRPDVAARAWGLLCERIFGPYSDWTCGCGRCGRARGCAARADRARRAGARRLPIPGSCAAHLGAAPSCSTARHAPWSGWSLTTAGSPPARRAGRGPGRPGGGARRAPHRGRGRGGNAPRDRAIDCGRVQAHRDAPRRSRAPMVWRVVCHERAGTFANTIMCGPFEAKLPTDRQTRF